MIPREDCYLWMIQAETGEPNLDMLLDLRKGVEELGELNGSFRLQDVVDRHHHVKYSEEFLWAVGSWELPDRISTSRVTRWVNPNYVHKETYTDLTARCECGAYITSERNLSFQFEGGDTEHTDDCRDEWQEEARDELVQKRVEWIETAARLYLTIKETAPRMGVKWRSMDKICSRHGIDWQEERKAGRARAILTWRRLHDEHGFTWAEIAEAFGQNPATVRSYGRGHGWNIDV